MAQQEAKMVAQMAADTVAKMVASVEEKIQTWMTKNGSADPVSVKDIFKPWKGSDRQTGKKRQA